MQFLNGLLVISKIFLTSYEDNRETLAEMKHFGYPLYEQSYQCLFFSLAVRRRWESMYCVERCTVPSPARCQENLASRPQSR